MKNFLISEAIGDIAGSAYEGRTRRTKRYDKVKMFSSRARFTDDTVLTFACAEAFLNNLDMTMNLWKCANEHRNAGFGSKFKKWFASHYPQPYGSKGNGSAMRCSSAGWMAKTEEECVELATKTALPTHNHPEGIKGAVVTALTIFHLKNGKDKEFIRENMLKKYKKANTELKLNPSKENLDKVRPYWLFIIHRTVTTQYSGIFLDDILWIQDENNDGKLGKDVNRVIYMQK